ncbi:hypothetical protein PCE1_001209 [Barthelona sp. PCE]
MQLQEVNYPQNNEILGSMLTYAPEKGVPDYKNVPSAYGDLIPVQAVEQAFVPLNFGLQKVHAAEQKCSEYQSDFQQVLHSIVEKYRAFEELSHKRTVEITERSLNDAKENRVEYNYRLETLEKNILKEHHNINSLKEEINTQHKLKKEIKQKINEINTKILSLSNDLDTSIAKREEELNEKIIEYQNEEQVIVADQKSFKKRVVELLCDLDDDLSQQRLEGFTFDQLIVLLHKFIRFVMETSTVTIENVQKQIDAAQDTVAHSHATISSLTDKRLISHGNLVEVELLADPNNLSERLQMLTSMEREKIVLGRLQDEVMDMSSWIAANDVTNLKQIIETVGRTKEELLVLSSEKSEVASEMAGIGGIVQTFVSNYINEHGGSPHFEDAKAAGVGDEYVRFKELKKRMKELTALMKAKDEEASELQQLLDGNLDVEALKGKIEALETDNAALGDELNEIRTHREANPEETSLLVMNHLVSAVEKLFEDNPMLNDTLDDITAVRSDLESEIVQKKGAGYVEQSVLDNQLAELSSTAIAMDEHLTMTENLRLEMETQLVTEADHEREMAEVREDFGGLELSSERIKELQSDISVGTDGLVTKEQLEVEINEARNITRANTMEEYKSHLSVEEHESQLQTLVREFAATVELPEDQRAVAEEQVSEFFSKKLNAVKEEHQAEIVGKQEKFDEKKDQTEKDWQKDHSKLIRDVARSEKRLAELKDEYKEAVDALTALESELTERQGAGTSMRAAEKQLKTAQQELKDEISRQRSANERELTAIEEENQAKLKEAREQSQHARDNLEETVKDMQKEVFTLKQRKSDLVDEIKQLVRSIEGLNNKIEGLEEEIKKYGEMEAKAEDIKKDIETYKNGITKVGAMRSKAMDIAKKERKLRMIYRSELEDILGNIRVYARIRPMSKKEVGDPEDHVAVFSMDEYTLADKTTNVRGKEEVREQMFDRVYGSDSTQQEVFNSVERLCQAPFDGKNVAIFAYGQTGAGKTFTMYGPDNDNPGEPVPRDLLGVTPRAILKLYELKEKYSNDYDVEISYNMVEVYLKDIRDLFEPKVEKDVKPRLVGGRVELQNAATFVNVESAEKSFEIIDQAKGSRVVASTSMNSVSSRSHLILLTWVKSTNKQNPKDVSLGKMLFVDLAGSERLGDTNTEGQRKTEGIEINYSLSLLSRCIQILSEGSGRVPFRDHPLTQIMQDALVGDSKTLMFVNISPSFTNVSQTRIALNYAARAKGIVKSGATDGTERVEKSLKNQIESLQALLEG